MKTLLSLVLAANAATAQTDQALLAAAAAGDAPALRRLLALGAGPGTRDQDGYTPLMRAAGSQSAAAVKLLLAAGSDPNAARRTGWTALMEAAAHGRADAARLLLAAGARPDDRDRAFGTALDLAERKGHAAVVELLRRGSARGSGRSVGAGVCALGWNGAGFCGRVEAIEATRSLIRVDGVRGCDEGCAPDEACSDRREVGGTAPDAVRAADSVWTQSWCLTHTGLE